MVYIDCKAGISEKLSRKCLPGEEADAMVELTLPKNANIYASQYQLYLSSKEDLKKRLMEWADAAVQNKSGGR